MKVDKINNLKGDSFIIISTSQLNELDITHSADIISNTINESNNYENSISRDSIFKDFISISEDLRYIDYILI